LPGGDRPWEGAKRHDGEISRSAGLAIGMLFSLVMIASLIVVGFSLPGLVVGGALGTITIVVVSKVVAMSDRGPSDGPPPQLL
jgi:hypothetical protein